MSAILSALLQLARTTERFTEAEANGAYNRLWRLFWLALLVCAVGLAANLWGYKRPSLALAIVWGIVAIYQWAKLYRLGIVTGAGLVAGLITRTPREESIETALRLYARCLLWLLLVPATFLLIMGKVFVEGNIEHILSAIVGIIVFTLLVTMWPKVFPGNMGKKSVYYFAVAIIVLALGGLVSDNLGALVVKHTGWDPAAVVPTSTETSLYQLARTQRETAEEDRSKEIDRVTAKVKSRKALTPAEVQVVAEAQRSKASAKHDARQASQDCPQYGSTKAEECMVTEESIILSSTETMHPGEFDLCHVLPNGGAIKSEWLNTSRLKLTSTGGTFPIRYKLFRHAELVGGQCPETF